MITDKLVSIKCFSVRTSCLLVRTLLRFAGFHGRSSLGLLRGLLYLEVCKLRSASSIELKITTFRKSLLYLYIFLSLALFFWKTENLFCVLRYRFP